MTKSCCMRAASVSLFGGGFQKSIDKFARQIHLNSLGKTRSKERVLQFRDYMKAIFAEATAQVCTWEA
jgi:hypothetical protein